MKFDHEKQRRIILELMLHPSLSFNQLWDRKDDSNKIAYHINKLERDGLIRKVDGKYGLTKQGRAASAFLDVEGKSTSFPTLAHITVIRKGNKILCQERLKEPFRGYYSFVTGSLQFGKSLFETIAQ